MAKRPEYSKLTITSQVDPRTGEYNIYDYNRDIQALINQAVKSALPEGAFFYAKGKEINPRTGEMKVDVFVHKDQANIVEESLAGKSELLVYDKASGNEKYNISGKQNLSKDELKEVWNKENNKETESVRFNRGTFLKILGAVMAVADIARRILSAVSALAVQTTKDMRSANNLGISYETLRGYRHTEKAHNMREGILAEGASDVQKFFGNITKLDEQALSDLAVVMGGEIRDLAVTGLGSSNPDELMGKILDAFMAKANSGYNSVGQYVGEQQARRELYSYLLKISPAWADIFATMQEEQHNINSLFHNQADTFEEWKKIVPTQIGGNKPQDYNLLDTLGQQVGLIKDSIAKIQEAIAVSLAPTLVKLLRRVMDWRFGMSEAENQQRNEENRQANENFIASAKATVKSMEDKKLSPEQEQYKLGLEYYIDYVSKNNKPNKFTGNIGYYVPIDEEIVVRGTDLASKGASNKAWLGTFDYDENVKAVVDSYIGAEQVKKDWDKYTTDLANKADTEANRRIEATEAERKQELKAKATKMVTEDTESPYYLNKKKRWNPVNLANALNMADLELMYKDDMIKKGQWEEWNSLTTAQKTKWAVDNKYANWNKSHTVATPIEPEGLYALSVAERQNMYKLITGEAQYQPNEEAFYMDEFVKYRDRLVKHLAKMFEESAKGEVTGNNAYYDMLRTFSLYGEDLSGLNNKIDKTYSGTASIASIDTAEKNGTFTHKIILDLNNNGVLDVGELILDSWTNTRAGFSGTAIDEVEIKDGRIVRIGKTVSQVQEAMK